MLSRVADRVYWMSRYLERAENAARLVDVYGKLLLDLPGEAKLGWEEVFLILGLEEILATRDSRAQVGTAPAILLADLSEPFSLLSALGGARENARTTRDVVPSEAWRTINELHMYATRHLPIEADRPEALIEIVERCQQVCGILDSTMAHGHAYQFVRLGRNLERADMISRMIDVAAAILMSGRAELEPFEDSLWSVTLRSLSAYQAYRQAPRRPALDRGVIGFLLQDPEFPRSIVHCTNRMEQALERLPGGGKVRPKLEMFASRVAALDPERLSAPDLHAEIDRFQLELAGLHEAIFETWLNPGHAA